MDNLQKIKDACIKANPEIMELKFGCVYQNSKFDYIATITGFSDEQYHIELNRGGKSVENKSTMEEKADDYIILGRPIRLADVLLTLEDILMSVSVTNKVDYGKASFILEPVGSMKHFMWNLKDDNLEHQSEETINCIANLL